MSNLYPLLLEPVFKQRVWGGRRLTRWFPQLPDGPIGEAWVMSDHPQGRTPVRNGPLAGETLHSLRERFGAGLLGNRGVSGETEELSVLIKLLNSQEDLSVQVHPPDHYEELSPGELGKTEMWVVLDARPGARVIYGLKEGVTSESFALAVGEGRIMDALRQIEVKAGDVLYVPSGTIHALGAGLLVAEIQQSSDTVYRLYDYDRPGLDGQLRALHLGHALRVVDYGEPPEPTHPTPPSPNRWDEICRSPYFVVCQGACRGRWPQRTGPESFQAIMVLEGTGALAWADGQEPLHGGNMILVPACLGRYTLTGAFTALLVSSPPGL